MFPNDIEEKIYGSTNQQLLEGHIQSHEVLNDALTAVETKVGVDGSEDTNSIDYKLNHNVALLDEADGVIDSNYIPSNVAILDSNNKLPVSNLPAITINETYTCSSQAEMLALDAQPGDVCVRSDEAKIYWLSQTPASTLANWLVIQEGESVSSVFGRTGTIVATAGDYDANQVDYDNTNGIITANDTNVQDAIEHLDANSAITGTGTFLSGTNTCTITNTNITSNHAITIFYQDNLDEASDLIDLPSSTAGSFTLTASDNLTADTHFGWTAQLINNN